MPRLNPMSLEVHYCRLCGEKFSERSPLGATPHTQTWHHMVREHRDDLPKDYAPCSRNCEWREQHEESHLGRRLYGWNLPPRPPKTSAELREQYNRMFPED